MLAEGIYQGAIQDWGFGESSNGKPLFDLVAVLTHYEGPDGLEELERPVRRSLPQYLSSSGAVKISAANLRSLGYLDKTFARLNPANKDGHNFKGTPVTVEVKHEEYNGRLLEKVNLVRKSRRLAESELEGVLSEAESWFEEEQGRSEEKAKERAAFDPSEFDPEWDKITATGDAGDILF